MLDASLPAEINVENVGKTLFVSNGATFMYSLNTPGGISLDLLS